LPGFDRRPGVERAVERRGDDLAVGDRGGREHGVGDVLLRDRRIARMADTDSKPPEVLGSELCGDVLQPVVTGDAPAELHLRLARKKVELIVDDQDLRRRNREKARRGGDRPPGEIHLRYRFQETHVALRLGEMALELPLPLKRGPELRRKSVDEPEASVVAGERVFATRIA